MEVRPREDSGVCAVVIPLAWVDQPPETPLHLLPAPHTLLPFPPLFPLPYPLPISPPPPRPRSQLQWLTSTVQIRAFWSLRRGKEKWLLTKTRQQETHFFKHILLSLRNSLLRIVSHSKLFRSPFASIPSFILLKLIMVPLPCPQPDKGLGKVRERVNYMFLVNRLFISP